MKRVWLIGLAALLLGVAGARDAVAADSDQAPKAAPAKVKVKKSVIHSDRRVYVVRSYYGADHYHPYDRYGPARPYYAPYYYGDGWPYYRPALKPAYGMPWPYYAAGGYPQFGFRLGNSW
jgi:hypothetical protein